MEDTKTASSVSPEDVKRVIAEALAKRQVRASDPMILGLFQSILRTLLVGEVQKVDDFGQASHEALLIAEQYVWIPESKRRAVWRVLRSAEEEYRAANGGKWPPMRRL